MKASELIEALQDAVHEYGDMDILVRDIDSGYSWTMMDVCPDPPTPMEQSDGEKGSIDINIFEEES